MSHTHKLVSVTFEGLLSKLLTITPFQFYVGLPPPKTRLALYKALCIRLY